MVYTIHDAASHPERVFIGLFIIFKSSDLNIQKRMWAASALESKKDLRGAKTSH